MSTALTRVILALFFFFYAGGKNFWLGNPIVASLPSAKCSSLIPLCIFYLQAQCCEQQLLLPLPRSGLQRQQFRAALLALL